jgi:hypothetical protein
MPFAYDRLLWGYAVATVATAVALVASIGAATASTELGAHVHQP